MKTLSIKQPWASLIMSGVKRVENRTWATTHRGSLLIHAGQAYDKAGAELLDGLGIGYLKPDAAPRGVILGQVDLIDIVDHRPGKVDDQQTFLDCVEQHDIEHDPLAFGPVCWIVTDPKPLTDPIEALGRLSLWNFDLPEI